MGRQFTRSCLDVQLRSSIPQYQLRVQIISLSQTNERKAKLAVHLCRRILHTTVLNCPVCSDFSSLGAFTGNRLKVVIIFSQHNELRWPSDGDLKPSAGHLWQTTQDSGVIRPLIVHWWPWPEADWRLWVCEWLLSFNQLYSVFWYSSRLLENNSVRPDCIIL